METSGNQPPEATDLRNRRLPAWAAALLLLSTITLLFSSPLLTGLWTFPDGDFVHHFLPFAQFMADAWRNLELPLWNPYTYAGHPFWADVQAAVLYPVSNALLVLTLPFRSASSRLYFLQLEAGVHLLLAGYFTYLLAFALTNRFWPAMLGAVTFMLSGYLTGYPPLQLAILRTAVWLPLLLWLLLRAWREPSRWRYWLGAALVFTVAFFAGHTQTWMLLAYGSGGWVVALALGARSSCGSVLHPGRARIAGLASMAAIALGLVAAQLLPSVEFTRLTVRADVDYTFLAGGFPLRDTWQMLLPGVFTQFSPLYVGAIPLGLAFFSIACIVSLRKRSDTGHRAVYDNKMTRWAVGYFAILACLALLASYGENGFLFPLLYRAAPGWDMFRGQERAAYLVAFSLSILAAFGLSAVYAASNRFRRRFVLLYSVLVMTGVYAFGLLLQLPGATVVSNWRYLLIASLTLVFAMSLAVALWLEGWSVRREQLIFGLAALNLFITNMGVNLDYRSPAEAVATAPEIAALESAIADSEDATGLQSRAYNEYRVYEDYGMLTQVEDVWGSSPLRLSTYAVLFDEFPLDRMFQLTGVSHVLTWRRELFAPSQLMAEFPQSADSTYLHRLADPNPRLWIVHELISKDDDQALALLADHEFDLAQTVVLADEYGFDEWRSESGAGAVYAERKASNRLSLHVSGSQNGVLVVSENWMPGWRIERIECGAASACDLSRSHPSNLPLLTPLRANLSFVAIALPNGDVRFDLVYDPRSVQTGLLISAGTCLLLIIAGIVHIVRRRRSVA